MAESETAKGPSPWWDALKTPTGFAAVLVTTLTGLIEAINRFHDILKGAHPWVIGLAVLAMGVSLLRYLLAARARGRLAYRMNVAAFVGARPMTQEDVQSRGFFGREEQIDEMVSRVSDPQIRFLILFGETGCGKTSFLRAGVLPKLDQGGRFHSLYLRFFDQPVGELRESLRAVPAAPDRPPAAADPPAPATLLDELRLARARAGKTLLLFIDQFEEFYVNPVGGEDYQAVLDLVWHVIGQHASVDAKLVFCLRYDFLAEDNAGAGEAPEEVLEQYRKGLQEIFNKFEKLCSAMDMNGRDCGQAEEAIRSLAKNLRKLRPGDQEARKFFEGKLQGDKALPGTWGLRAALGALGRLWAVDRETVPLVKVHLRSQVPLVAAHAVNLMDSMPSLTDRYRKNAELVSDLLTPDERAQIQRTLLAALSALPEEDKQSQEILIEALGHLRCPDPALRAMLLGQLGSADLRMRKRALHLLFELEAVDEPLIAAMLSMLEKGRANLLHLKAWDSPTSNYDPSEMGLASHEQDLHAAGIVVGALNDYRLDDERVRRALKGFISAFLSKARLTFGAAISLGVMTGAARQAGIPLREVTDLLPRPGELSTEDYERIITMVFRFGSHDDQLQPDLSANARLDEIMPYAIRKRGDDGCEWGALALRYQIRAEAQLVEDKIRDPECAHVERLIDA